MVTRTRENLSTTKDMAGADSDKLKVISSTVGALLMTSLRVLVHLWMRKAQCSNVNRALTVILTKTEHSEKEGCRALEAQPSILETSLLGILKTAHQTDRVR